jgi:hypothetical protein
VLTIEGRMLDPLLAQLAAHQTKWIWERPDNRRMDGTTVVDSITCAVEVRK